MKESDRYYKETNAVFLPLTEKFHSSSPDNDSQNDLIGKSAIQKKLAESGGKIVWRIANSLMTVFFVMAVGVQFNDPDPYLWVPLYGIAAVLTVCVTIHPSVTYQKWWRIPYWIHTVYCIGMFCYVFVQLIIVAASPNSDGSINPLMYEEGREMAGIMITVIWLFTCKQSPSIKCAFPRWCKCCQPSRSPEQPNSDVLVDMSLSPFLVPQQRT